MEEEETQKITGGADGGGDEVTTSNTATEEEVSENQEEEVATMEVDVAAPVAEVDAPVVAPVPEVTVTTTTAVEIPIPGEAVVVAVPEEEQETQQIIAVAEENIVTTEETEETTPPPPATSEPELPTVASQENNEGEVPPPPQIVSGEDNEEEDYSDEGGDEDEEIGGSKTCTVCSKEFKRRSHLHRHMESLHGDGREIYRCPQCSSTFNRKDSLTRHLKSQHGDNPRRFKCSAGGCDSLFNRKDHLNKHLRNVHKLEVIAQTSSKLVESDEDDEDEEGNKQMTPMITEVSSLSEPGLTHEDKMQVQDKLRRFKCSQIGCDQEYANLDHLHRHLSRAHGGELSIGTVLGHSIFGEGEMITDGYSNEATLCMFCCNTFENSEELEKQRKGALASDRNFTKFCEAALRQQRKRMSANTIIKSLNGLEGLSVCQKCFHKIGYAMSTKSAADEVEGRVAELRKQLDLELKNLQSEVDQFYVEMKMIEETIRNSDLSSLEEYLKGIEGMEESSVVLLLRDGIFAVMNDVEVYCRRIGGQTVVVNTPQVRRIGGEGGGRRGRRSGGKGGRKSKGKGINPLLHVKVECEEDEGGKKGEGSGVGGDQLEGTADGGTPRRQPVRVARVKTEEFFKRVFGGEEEDDGEAVVKTEVESEPEGEGKGDEGEEMVTGDLNEEEKDKGDEEGKGDDGGKKKELEEGTGKKKKVEEKAEEVDGGAKQKSGEGGEVAVEGQKKKLVEGPIEEILIDGDDDLEDLFYGDEGESSDEDFNLDVTQDDLESVSESSEDSEEDSVEEDEDDDIDEFISNQPPPKKKQKTGGKGRGRPKGGGGGGGGGGRRKDYDPFSFSKKSKRSYKGPTPQSANKIASIFNIDFSNMSEFRKRLLCRMLKKSAKTKQSGDGGDAGASTNQEPDPRLNFQYDYSPETQSLQLGDVSIVILDDHGSLQCSKCGYLASPAEKPRRSVPRLMYNHILGKHLFAFQCPQCSATLGSYRRYLDHIKGHQMGFACDVCGKPLFSEEALRRHRWGHQNAEEMAEAINRGAKDPRRKYDPLQSFQCTTCGKVFAKKMLLRQHEKTHAENRERIVCQLCGKTFLPSGYISHQKYSCFPEGYEPPRVQCQMCPSTFKSVVLRARHMKYAHSAAASEKPFKCHICDKGFAANEHLQKHIKRHSDARPYLCRKGCGANYKTRKDCTRHEKKCEGNGTPMMRHKNRNDQLQAQMKQEPDLVLGHQVPSHDIHIQQQGHVQPQQIIGHSHQGIVAGPAGTVVLQVHHQQQLPQQMQQQAPQQVQVQVQHSQQQQQQQQPQQFNVYNIL